jgi:hypothetical protein
MQTSAGVVVCRGRQVPRKFRSSSTQVSAQVRGPRTSFARSFGSRCFFFGQLLFSYLHGLCKAFFRVGLAVLRRLLAGLVAGDTAAATDDSQGNATGPTALTSSA